MTAEIAVARRSTARLPIRLWRAPYLLLSCAAFLWAGNFVVGRVMSSGLPPVSLGFWRWALAAPLILPLADFSKIVDVLDRTGSSFVSVTQAFNTTTSMGRLTLNVLLSFAQFEREVTGERIRDKIAASKKKGLWMGGRPVFGYDPDGRTLTINPEEAEQVRWMFARYLEIKSVNRLIPELKARGVVSKRWINKAGEAQGGVPLVRGVLYQMLRNRIYVGEITHKGAIYPGQHPAIIDRDTFEAAQALLDQSVRRRQPGKARPLHRGAPLTGLIYDSAGHLMSPVCEPELASEYLTLRYIAACGEFIEHAAVYLESEERIAADLFLFDLAKGATKARFMRNAKACAVQLSRHAPLYFPDYHKLLRLAYLHALAAAPGLDELRRSGVLLLASATLPGVRSNVRRELRRRGATHDALLVPDDTVQALLGRGDLTALPSSTR